MRALFWIAVLGTIGCWARYGQTQLVQSMSNREFPVAVMSVNIVGSFLMGVLVAQPIVNFALGATFRTGVLTGFLGGYTTFSSFELETLLLIENGGTGKAVLYVGLSVGLGFLGIALGTSLARAL